MVSFVENESNTGLIKEKLTQARLEHVTSRTRSRLVDKSLNVCRGDSVQTLPAIQVVFSREY